MKFTDLHKSTRLDEISRRDLLKGAGAAAAGAAGIGASGKSQAWNTIDRDDGPTARPESSTEVIELLQDAWRVTRAYNQIAETLPADVRQQVNSALKLGDTQAVERAMKEYWYKLTVLEMQKLKP